MFGWGLHSPAFKIRDTPQPKTQNPNPPPLFQEIKAKNPLKSLIFPRYSGHRDKRQWIIERKGKGYDRQDNTQEV